ncbi:MAG: hypothetical protein ACLQO1_21520 [Steroidobacteraceae bacterium]
MADVLSAMTTEAPAAASSGATFVLELAPLSVTTAILPTIENSWLKIPSVNAATAGEGD